MGAEFSWPWGCERRLEANPAPLLGGKWFEPYWLKALFPAIKKHLQLPVRHFRLVTRGLSIRVWSGTRSAWQCTEAQMCRVSPAHLAWAQTRGGAPGSSQTHRKQSFAHSKVGLVAFVSWRNPPAFRLNSRFHLWSYFNKNLWNHSSWKSRNVSLDRERTSGANCKFHESMAWLWCQVKPCHLVMLFEI